MRVCHVCSGHSEDDGRVFHRECVTLAEAGYEVHLIARSARQEAYTNRGVAIHPLPVPKSRQGRLARRWSVARMAASLCPDLYHVHEPELLGPVLAIAGPHPAVWDVHESYLDVLMDRDWIPKWARLLVRTAWDIRERQLVRRCAGVVTVTQPIAERYRRLHTNVHVIANYPEIGPTDGPPEVTRDGRTCVFAGGLLPNRGLSQVIAALGLLRRRGLSVPLALAGPVEESYLRSLLDEAAREGIRELVTYHGMLSKAETRNFQLRSSIGLVTYLPVGNAVVSLPNKLVECMELGVPVVYSDFATFREVADGAPRPASRSTRRSRGRSPRPSTGWCAAPRPPGQWARRGDTRCWSGSTGTWSAPTPGDLR